MNNKQIIMLFDGSFKTTSFVRRLASALINDYQVYIVGFDERDAHKIKGVQYVGLGSSNSTVHLCWRSISLAIKSKSFGYLFQLPGYVLNKNITRIKEKNIKLAVNLIQPKIIHLQWISLLPLFESLIEEPAQKIILSLRGFQLNVRPYVNEENAAYLSTWFPVIDGFHAVSNAIQAKGKSFYPSLNKSSQVVYSGLNTTAFPFRLKKNKTEKLSIISVGRNHWIKGYDDALLACAILKEKNINFEYRIVGVANDEELLFYVDDLGLADHVVLDKLKSQAEVKELIRTADVLLLPSHEEGIANVVLEAMALGTPVISTDCGGMAEVIQHDISGWLIPIRNPKAMAQELMHLSNLEIEKIQTITRAARSIIEEQHTEEKMIADMKTLYNQVIAIDE